MQGKHAIRILLFGFILLGSSESFGVRFELDEDASRSNFWMKNEVCIGDDCRFGDVSWPPWELFFNRSSQVSIESPRSTASAEQVVSFRCVTTNDEGSPAWGPLDDIAPWPVPMDLSLLIAMSGSGKAQSGTYADSQGNPITELGSFHCAFEADAKLVWEVLPSEPHEELGMPVDLAIWATYSLAWSGSNISVPEPSFIKSLRINGDGIEPRYCYWNNDTFHFNSWFGPNPLYGDDITLNLGDTLTIEYEYDYYIDGPMYATDAFWNHPLTPTDLYVGVRAVPNLTDLVGEVDHAHLMFPPDRGADAQVWVELFVSNIGVDPTKPDQTIDLKFYLRPDEALGDSQDIHVATLQNVLIGELLPGSTKTLGLSVPLYIPSFTRGKFRLVVHIDSSNAVVEINEDNNVAVTTDWVIRITEPVSLFPDLIGEFRRIRYKGSLSPGTNIRADLYVSNIGTVPTEKKQVIDVEICLRPSGADDDSRDIPIATFKDQSVSNLRPDKSKTLKFTFDLPVVPKGAYRFVGKIDSSEILQEIYEDNNEALSNLLQIKVE